MYLLDTSTCIHFLNGTSILVEAQLRAHSPDPLRAGDVAVVSRPPSMDQAWEVVNTGVVYSLLRACIAFKQLFDEVRPYTEVRSLQARKFGPQIDKTTFGAPLEYPQRSG